MRVLLFYKGLCLELNKIGRGNYKNDKYYPKVVKAVGLLLQDRNEITTVDILLKMNNLSKYRYIMDSIPTDSSRAYTIAMLQCTYQNIKKHNKGKLAIARPKC